MKHLLTLIALLAVFYSFNSHASIFEGRVLNQGSRLECVVDNYSHTNIAVLTYSFEMMVRDYYGRVYPVRKNLGCFNNCIVQRGSYNIFYGPYVNYNVVGARCFGTYRVLHHY